MDASEFVSTCPNCGEELREEWAFCPFCGISLTESDETLADGKDDYAQVGRLSDYTLHFRRAQEAVEEDGDLEDALYDCEAALELDPKSAEAHNLRGLILDLLGNRGEAIQSYREAVRLDPQFRGCAPEPDRGGSGTARPVIPTGRHRRFRTKEIRLVETHFAGARHLDFGRDISQGG